MKNLAYLPNEQLIKDEAEYLKECWKSPTYEFLLSRSLQKYNHEATSIRRKDIESLLDTQLLPITDEMLFQLYLHACLKYQKRCNQDFNLQSGFLRTPQERMFMQTLVEIIKKNPNLKLLEVFPSSEVSKDLPDNFKMVIGNYVPDYVVFGLKTKKSSGIVFEIDGESHSKKYEKDLLRNRHLYELNLFTIEIPNDQVRDFKYIESLLLNLFKARTGSLNKQILRTKRMIWIKTVTCQMSLSEIEDFVKKNFNVQLYLLKEASTLLLHPKCPRAIKFELSNLQL